MSHLIWGWRGSGSPHLPQQQDCQASNWHHLISLRGPISLVPPNPCQHMHLLIERREMQSGTPLLKACWSLRWWPNRWFYFVPSHAAYIFSSALHVPPLCIFFFFSMVLSIYHSLSSWIFQWWLGRQLRALIQMNESVCSGALPLNYHVCDWQVLV